MLRGCCAAVVSPAGPCTRSCEVADWLPLSLATRSVRFEDFLYVKGFMVCHQPLPTPLSLAVNGMAYWAQRLCVVGMFLIEVPTPFLIFVGGWARIGAAVGIMGLQAAYFLTGNFGFFPVLSSVLCLPLFDSTSRLSFSALLSLDVFHLLYAVLLPGVLMSILFNSWVGHAWYYWPSLAHTSIVSFYRYLRPFHFFHAYGLFPPVRTRMHARVQAPARAVWDGGVDHNSCVCVPVCVQHSYPDVRYIPVFEGSLDGRVWREYAFKYQTCTTRSPPRFLWAFHARFDVSMCYWGMGMTREGFFHPLLASDPYHFTRQGLCTYARCRAPDLSARARSPASLIVRPSAFDLCACEQCNG
jgi:hypothetical protein